MELLEKVGGTEWNLRHGRSARRSAKTVQVAAVQQRVNGKLAGKVANPLRA